MSEPPDLIRIAVVDDQAAIREALAAVLALEPDLAVVATAKNGREAVELAIRERAQVVLMDLRMPVLDGIEATRELNERAPEVAVVVLTTFADDDSILAALDAGARGYLTKDAGRSDIARAIRAAAAGQAVLDIAVQARLVAASRAKPETKPGSPLSQVPPDLTPRESEVLGLIGQGLSNRGIAERLFVSEATVKTHINNLFAKADLRDRAEAVRRAIDYGLA
ncbi:MAG: LuxR family transcriptional regulator [Pseudonocardiales bacterium]|nr:LuxR family transcriptional regulator [Pseudonocardiales bacterium]